MSGSNKVTLYKYVSLKYLADLINNQYLYMDDGSNYNDPFDNVFLAKKGLVHNKGFHIVCLTNSNNNKLLWAHYADSYKGVMISVEIDKKFLYPVFYSKTRVKKTEKGFNVDLAIKNSKSKYKGNVIFDVSSVNEYKKVALIKGPRWNYEKEYRIIVDNKEAKELIKQNKIIKKNGKLFFKVKIKEICFGCYFDKQNESVKDNILKACLKNNVLMKTLKLSTNNYDLSKEKYSKPILIITSEL